MKTRIRHILFWFHLLTGVAAGTIVAVLCITGVALAFGKELTSWAERHSWSVSAASDSEPPAALDTISLLTEAPEASEGSVELMLHRDPGRAILVSIGRESAHYVDPYSGVVLGPAVSSMRTFMNVMLRMHRWLALSGDARNWGKAITGAANTVFFLLALSGLYLWWPRRWNWKNLRPVLLFAGSKGKMRDWNWHHVIGIWTLPVVLVLTFTGMVISYPWLSQRLIQMAGDAERPWPDSVALEPDFSAAPVNPDGPVVSGFHDAFRILAEAYPDWKTIQLRKGLPRRGGAPQPSRNGPAGEHGGPGGIAPPFSATIRERGAWPLFSSTQVVLDSYSGRIVHASDYHELSNGRKLRSWIRFLHTGEALGWPGQLLAGIASAGGVLLVWTGFALAWRRLVAAIRRRRRS